MLGVFHLAEVAKKAFIFLILLKYLQSFAVLQVVTNCPISSHESHIPRLAFTRVEEDSIIRPFVGVAVLFA